MSATRSEIPPTRKGYQFSECSSAMQKSIRRCDEETALFFATELEASGYGEYVFRRLRLIASEDIGLAEPHMPATIRALYENYVDAKKKKDDKQESWRLFLVHAVILLSRARKSRCVDHALLYFYNSDERIPVPDIARDGHTAAGRKMGRREKFFFEESSLLVDPESGELGPAPCIPDAYRERAIEATGEKR